MLGIGERHELPTILLIDDDLVSREVIATVLTLHGHLVHTAEDGNEALQMLKQGVVTPGVVLLDTQLPGLSGRELIEELRMLGLDEIILISGSTPSDELVDVADGFLLKPFGPEDLAKLLGQHKPKIDQESNGGSEDMVVTPTTLAQFQGVLDLVGASDDVFTSMQASLTCIDDMVCNF